MELRYKTNEPVPRVGVGASLEMGSREIVFRSDQPLKQRTKLEISLAWPALLNDHVLLQLVVCGEVVWCQGSMLTVAFWKYHFRTRGLSRDAQPAPELAQTAVAPAGVPLRAAAGANWLLRAPGDSPRE